MRDLLRKIPKVDQILNHERWTLFTGPYPETVAKEALRHVLDELRKGIKAETITALPTVLQIIAAAHRKAGELFSPGLRRVVNGTGVIIHTNLGRSLLARSAIEGIMNAGSYYTNLEYDLDEGERGDRYVHCAGLITKLVGAEAALVVNNNAAAVYLVLNTLAEGKEALLSRGELVEIGGSFRVPDVMRKAGVTLREVGTTNRTYREDYERSIREQTGLILRVHPSNYRVRGFTYAPSSEDLVNLGRRYNIPTFFDAGSGLMINLGLTGWQDEPVIPEEVSKGWDVISYSGDKLLGGPQAGIIVGKKDLVDAMQKNPLARAMRPDKFTLAALENTLLIYLDTERAKRDIPTLRMILADLAFLRKQARRLRKQITMRVKGLSVTILDVTSQVGGGSLPDVALPSCGLGLKPEGMTASEFERRLHRADPPVVGRIENDMVVLDMRTLLMEDEPFIVGSIEGALRHDQ
jgi:L-seryl-tRNA(Ser) seleniumtransferase